MAEGTEAPKKKVSRKSTSKRLTLSELSEQELTEKKAIILDLLCKKYDREAAARKVGLSIRQLRVLLLRDENFRQDVLAVRTGDDEILMDKSRRNLHELLDWRHPNHGRPSEAITKYVSAAYAGYTEKRFSTVAKTSDVPADPVDMDEYKPKPSVKEKVTLPAKQKELPPEREFEDGNIVNLNFNK